MHSAAPRLCVTSVSLSLSPSLSLTHPPTPSIFVLYKFINAIFMLAAVAALVGQVHQWRVPELATSVEATSVAGVPGTPFLDMRFSLDVDVAPLFGWNVNQVFVYVTLEREDVPGQPGVSSYVTLYDEIVTRPEDGHIALESVRPEYLVKRAAADGARLRVSIETDPKVGFFRTRRTTAPGPPLQVGGRLRTGAQ